MINGWMASRTGDDDDGRWFIHGWVGYCVGLLKTEYGRGGMVVFYKNYVGGFVYPGDEGPYMVV